MRSKTLKLVRYMPDFVARFELSAFARGGWAHPPGHPKSFINASLRAAMSS
jgi:hypothetical protein